MATEWPELPLEECMAAIIDYRGKTPRKTTSGIPLVTAKIIKGGRIERPEEFIDPADYDDWMRRGIPKAGDIVLPTEAPLGEVAQLDGSKVALAQRVITLRGKEGLVDNTFLKFLLQYKDVQEQLQGRSTGTTVHGIRQSELRKVLLPVPPFDEQRAIAHILGTLDDKIEINQRMNETLEAMAQAIFKSWFVDFNPIPGLGPHKEWQDLHSLGADSAVPGLNRNMAYMNKMLIPPSEIISDFDDQVKPLADKVEHNNSQSRTLASIRDAMLPKLLSGEIRVKNAESFVGRNP